MEKFCGFVATLLFLVSLLFNGGAAARALSKNQDASEEWGYVEVRPSKFLELFFLIFVYFTSIFFFLVLLIFKIA